MGLVDKALWENRHADPAAIEAELRGPKSRGWLMRWLPTRAHDNGLFLVYSNGVGVDDNEIRTGNAMILDPQGVTSRHPNTRSFSQYRLVASFGPCGYPPDHQGNSVSDAKTRPRTCQRQTTTKQSLSYRSCVRWRWAASDSVIFTLTCMFHTSSGPRPAGPRGFGLSTH
jgi:hypothetical protein